MRKALLGDSLGEKQEGNHVAGLWTRSLSCSHGLEHLGRGELQLGMLSWGQGLEGERWGQSRAST